MSNLPSVNPTTTSSISITRDEIVELKESIRRLNTPTPPGPSLINVVVESLLVPRHLLIAGCAAIATAIAIWGTKMPSFVIVA